MTVTYQGKPLKVILTDIEGTTTDITFVHQILFPYSAKYLPNWVHNHLESPIVQQILQQVREMSGKSHLDVEGCLTELMIWHTEDRKITPLKTLQGLIWKEGYDSGKLRAHVYPDVVECLNRWYAASLTLAVYSSGSIAAQKLLLGNTLMGDLTPLISMYFDTNTGSKIQSQSYLTIAQKLFVLPQEILFLSDFSEELSAASSADLNVCGLNRQNTASDNKFMYVKNFLQIPLQFS